MMIKDRFGGYMGDAQELQKTKAFVIGPIGDKDAELGSFARQAYEEGIEVLENVIVPACESLDIDAFRADQISKSGEIPEQVFRYLRDSQIVIADLTDANPNVMYELGLRHTTGKLTLQIGERNKLPFDISTIRTILFKRSELGFIEARRALIRALAEGLETGGDPVTATRIWFEPVDGQFPLRNAAGDPQAIDDGDAPGFLELMAETESGIVEIGQTLETGASILAEVTRIIEEGTKKIKAIPVAGNYSASKLAITNRVAALLEDPAVRLGMVAQDYAKHVDRAYPGMVYMLEEAAREPGLIEQVREPLEQISGLVTAAHNSVESAQTFISVMRDGGNSTRSMRRVTASICKSSEKISEASKKLASWRTLLGKLGVESK